MVVNSYQADFSARGAKSATESQQCSDNKVQQEKQKEIQMGRTVLSLYHFAKSDHHRYMVSHYKGKSQQWTMADCTHFDILKLV